jgi:hypothetical protein
MIILIPTSGESFHVKSDFSGLIMKMALQFAPISSSLMALGDINGCCGEDRRDLVLVLID